MKVSRHRRTAMVLGFVLFAVVGCGGGGGGYSSGNQSSSGVVEVDCASVTPSQSVNIPGLLFTPSSVTVAVNSVVKWTNNDTVTHTVTSGAPGGQDGKFSKNLPVGSSVCFRFETAGSYRYFCSIHTSMTGTVTVN